MKFNCQLANVFLNVYGVNFPADFDSISISIDFKNTFCNFCNFCKVISVTISQCLTRKNLKIYFNFNWDKDFHQKNNICQARCSCLLGNFCVVGIYNTHECYDIYYNFICYMSFIHFNQLMYIHFVLCLKFNIA